MVTRTTDPRNRQDRQWVSGGVDGSNEHQGLGALGSAPTRTRTASLPLDRQSTPPLHRPPAIDLEWQVGLRAESDDWRLGLRFLGPRAPNFHLLEGYLLNDDRNAYPGIIASARGACKLPWSEYRWNISLDSSMFVANLYIADGEEICGAITLPNTLADAIYAKASHSVKSAKSMGIFFRNAYGSFVHNSI